MPTPDPRSGSPQTRLDVRLHGGRPVAYSVAEQFLIGTAAACDLRLPDLMLPPVVCQITRRNGQLVLQRLAESPVLLNDQPVPPQQPLALNDGDAIAVGPVEIRVALGERDHLFPRLVPVADVPAADAGAILDRRELERLRDELNRRQAAIDEQARELEDDRKLWYRRRHEMEAELEQLRSQNTRAAQHRASEADGTLTARQAELGQYEAELAAARERLARDLQAGREELTRLAEEVRHGREQLDSERQAQSDDLARQRGEMEAAIFTRREQAEREFADRQRALEAEIALRRLEFERDVREFEPRLVQLRFEREQLESARAALEADRRSIADLRAELARDRQAFDRERAWHEEHRAQRMETVVQREADLDLRESRLKQERELLDSERQSCRAESQRLNLRQVECDGKQAALDARAAELDEHYSQLRRDAAELEEQVRIAAGAEERLHAEQERLDRHKLEMDAQAAAFADRLAQVEAQHASLALLRANLERMQEDLQRDVERVAASRGQAEELLNEVAMHNRGDAQFTNHDSDIANADAASSASSSSQALVEFEVRLKEREAELQAGEALLAEQAAELKAKLLQSLELQQRLEADRAALREREAALAEAEAARQALQEQLRRRADELGSRGQQIDLAARAVAEERVLIERQRASIDEWRSRAEVEVAAQRHELEQRTEELEQCALALKERERTLERQIERLKEAGGAIAAERKSLFDTRQALEIDLAESRQRDLATRHDSEFAVATARELLSELRRQSPELEERAEAALQKLDTARTALRGHLAQLHEFAREARQAVAADRDALAQREQLLEQARAEHQQALSSFRQQILDWHAKVNELRQAAARSDTRTGNRELELDTTTERLKILQQELDRRTAELHEEQRVAIAKRNEMERHLAEMREWYRHKLRELAAGRRVDEADMPEWHQEAAPEPAPQLTLAAADDDADDDRLAATLAERGLLDRTMVSALREEARRQRRSLRQTLLASGVVTLYQLALIEAGQLDGLVLGRFRLIDRLRNTSREVIYRAFDPERPHQAVWLRALGDAECTDRLHREEYVRRFTAAAQRQHANRVNVLEVLEVNGRPCVVQEAVAGLPSGEWPPLAAAPGVWLRLLTEAARGIADAHEAGIVHGRLTADQFNLGPDGVLRTAGWGEPHWLSAAAAAEPTAAGDLRALGRAAFAWSQIGAKRRPHKDKAFPAELAAIVRRLEAGGDSPMGDVVSREKPFAGAAEVLAELEALAADRPCPPDAWNKLVASIGVDPAEEEPLRQSA